MSKLPLFKPQITPKEKPLSSHPWERSIKDKYAHLIKNSHNSIHNPRYPAKEKLPGNNIKFTVIGNRFSKEFIYCVRLVQGISKYRSKVFGPPVIRGVTGVEWPCVLKDIKLKYGGLAFCLLSQVAVLIDDIVVGGETELKELIESKYIYYLCLDYYKEAVSEFARFVNLAGLYSDIVPKTCENFLRLCKSTKAGYGGTPIHRIVKDGWIQGGGYSLRSSNLNCENFDVAHDKRGVICMANDGRDVDCSTQFFVLLQPAPWMANKYVAFGQLIDGENVLQRLENEPTYYEAPVNYISIDKTGILNLDCHDIIINKNSRFHIHKHIDDLVAVGVMFYEMLLERVFLEIQFRELENYKQQEGEGESRTEETLPKVNIKMDGSKRRVMKKREAGSSVGDYRSTLESIEDVNEDFDVEDYVPEQYSSTELSVSTGATYSVGPTSKPFYLPLTDVPYPDEKDSTYDLKKFLRGDYCLESDLDEVIMRTRIALGENESFLSAQFFYSDDDQESLSSEDCDVKKYLKSNADRISFAGEIVRQIGRGHGMMNLLENARKSELVCFNDEEFRILRKISTVVPDSERRLSRNVNVMKKQPVFIKAEELPKEEVEEEEEKYENIDIRKISIQVPKGDKGEIHREFKRRQTEFVKQEDLAKILMFKKGENSDSDDDEDSDEERKVRIAESTRVSTGAQAKRRATTFVRPKDIPNDDEDDLMAKVQKYHEQTLGIGVGRGGGGGRVSYATQAHHNKAPGVPKAEPAPTLKGYQPTSGVQSRNMLLRGPKTTTEKEPVNPEKSSYLRPSLTIEDDVKQAVKSYQKRDKKDESLTDTRPAEYGKSRPSISVSEYQKMNQTLSQLNKHTDKKKSKPVEVVKEVELGTTPAAAAAPSSLRLPGDSPLWSSDSTLSDVVSIYTTRRDPSTATVINL